MRIRSVLRRWLPPVAVDAWATRRGRGPAVAKAPDLPEVASALELEPWSEAYRRWRRAFLERAVADVTLRERLRRGEALPPGYGAGLDERCVEYPWLLASLPTRPGLLLDAGSTLAYRYLLLPPPLRDWSVHVMTQTPPRARVPRDGLSYLACDLRDVFVRDATYDAVACISTLEHVGMDNVQFTGDPAHREHRPDDFRIALREMRRVLRPGGCLLLTVPFGAYQDLGSAQQFDRARLAEAIEAFGPAEEVTTSCFRQQRSGWQRARLEDCADCRYVEWMARAPAERPARFPVQPDGATAARAVACVRLVRA